MDPNGRSIEIGASVHPRREHRGERAGPRATPTRRARRPGRPGRGRGRPGEFEPEFARADGAWTTDRRSRGPRGPRPARPMGPRPPLRPGMGAPRQGGPPMAGRVPGCPAAPTCCSSGPNSAGATKMTSSRCVACWRNTAASERWTTRPWRPSAEPWPKRPGPCRRRASWSTRSKSPRALIHARSAMPCAPTTVGRVRDRPLASRSHRRCSQQSRPNQRTGRSRAARADARLIRQRWDDEDRLGCRDAGPGSGCLCGWQHGGRPTGPAGQAVAEEAFRLVTPGERVVVFVGHGNNGRDGAVAAASAASTSDPGRSGAGAAPWSDRC